jgi:hypothetical protein
MSSVNYSSLRDSQSIKQEHAVTHPVSPLPFDTYNNTLNPPLIRKSQPFLLHKMALMPTSNSPFKIYHSIFNSNKALVLLTYH